jgi:hypothetical protein
MRRKVTPQRVLANLENVISAWEANADFKMNDEITLAKLKAQRDKLTDCIVEVTSKRTELTGLTSDRDDCAAACAELVTRVRSSFRGFYGPNSKQYEQAGGTRTSARKKPARRSGSLSNAA